VNRTVHVACNFTCIIETEGLLKVKASKAVSYAAKVVIPWKRCKIQTIRPTLSYHDVRRCTAYSIAAIPMTLSGFGSYSPIASLFKYDISYLWHVALSLCMCGVSAIIIG